jgi:hypothetical protein
MRAIRLSPCTHPCPEPRKCQGADWQELTQRREQRDREQRALEESIDPLVGILRTAARARRLGLAVSASARSNPFPFQPRYESTEFVFTDTLPDYIDPNTFRAPEGPGRVFAGWLASFIPPRSAVIRVAPLPEGVGWNSFGCAPLIAELARPPLHRGRQPLQRVMRRMNVAFVRDIHDMGTVEIAQTDGLEDYFLYPKDTRDGTFLIDGEPRETKVGSESRGAYRHAETGRKWFSRLGAWPWCLAEEGKLPGEWYYQEDYLKAFAQWNYQQTCALYAAACHSTPSRRLPAGTAKDLARDAYREMYLTGGFARDAD